MHDSVSANEQRARDITPILIEPVAPAIFAHTGNIAAALHANSQAISESSPAAPGDIISIYATGLGAVTLKNGLEVASATTQVYIDGIAARVTFAGRAPGFQGLDQINVQIPAGVHRVTSVSVVVASTAPECPVQYQPNACATIARASNTALLPIN
jgi:uncharacterized protein (TIGR03437 family)